MRAAEVAADDAWSALSSTEEAAGLGWQVRPWSRPIQPLVLLADIAFTENRFPLRRTGVFPFSPQGRPVT